MRLTNHLRDCFIRAVTNDIPEVVPPTLKEVQDALYENFDPRIKAVFDDENLRKHLNTTWCFLATNHNAYVVHAGQDVSKLPIIVAYKAAQAKRNDVIIKLRGVANGCSTLKALKEALPELVKYMVDDEKKPTPGLPVPAGIYDDLKAIGLKVK